MLPWMERLPEWGLFRGVGKVELQPLLLTATAIWQIFFIVICMSQCIHLLENQSTGLLKLLRLAVTPT